MQGIFSGCCRKGGAARNVLGTAKLPALRERPVDWRVKSSRKELIWWWPTSTWTGWVRRSRIHRMRRRRCESGQGYIVSSSGAARGWRSRSVLVHRLPLARGSRSHQCRSDEWLTPRDGSAGDAVRRQAFVLGWLQGSPRGVRTSHGDGVGSRRLLRSISTQVLKTSSQLGQPKVF